MKKHTKNLALFLSLLSVFSLCIPANVFAEDVVTNTADEKTQIVAEEVTDATWFDEEESSPVHEQPDVGAYEDNDIVTAIVELEEEPVLAYYDQSTYLVSDSESEDGGVTSGEAVSQFLATEDAQELSEELLNGQDRVLSQISSLDATSEKSEKKKTSFLSKLFGTAEETDTPISVEVVAQWTRVANAMAVKVPYGKLDEIAEMDGVKRAYVQHVYDRPETESVDLTNPSYSYSLDMVGVEEAWNEGYTGKGMLVAVLDTGIDVIQNKATGVYIGGHEAFRDDSFKSGDPDAEDGWTLRYTEDSIEAFLADTDLYANMSLIDGSHITYDNNALYKNRKVPYGFDYADWDVHPRPTSSDHGVHVSGTIAGYAETEEGQVTFSGVAPDAQILAMKVFPDEDGGAEEFSIVCALEDSMVLGADIINLSLGSDNGFAGDDTMQNDVFALVEQAGVVMMTSAGNSSYSSANNNYGGENTVENPDTSMMSSPAVYASNLSVASIDNVVNSVSYLYYTIDGVEHEAFFNDTNGTMAAMFSDKEYPIYAVGGTGTYDDYYSVGFNNGYNGGRDGIALVKRGEISFADKINNANSFTGINSRGERYGVQAVIIYDSDPESSELISMSVDGTSLPSCFISGKDGQAIVNALEAGQAVTIRTATDQKLIENETGGQMSSYSSWGAGPSLELKPEITAPGGNIWSSIIDTTAADDESYVGTYGMMSGTSMAAPHMTGMGTLVRQRVNTSGEFTGVTAAETGDIVSQLLVSTAIPQTDANGVYYSPRQQGAGLADVAAAITTDVYISVDGKNVGKLELGDDKDMTGTYPIEFNLHNISNTDVTYQASVVLMRPATSTVASEWGERAVTTAYDEIIKTVDLGQVTAKAGTTTTFSQTVSLDEGEKAALKELFPNGTFVEGFVILTDVGSTQPQLGLPLLSFFGDWTKPPILDSATWLDAAADEEGNMSFLNNETTWSPAIIGSQLISGGSTIGYYNLGQNIFDSASVDQVEYHEGNIELSPNGDGYLDKIDDLILYLLRDAKVVVLEARDAETNELYYHEWMSYVPRSAYSSTYGFVIPSSLYFSPSWDGTDLDGETLPNGTKCIYTVTAFGDGDYSEAGETWSDYYEMNVTDFSKIIPGELEPTFNSHAMDKTGDVISFPVTIDTEAPKLENNAISVYTKEDGHTYIKGTVTDADGSLASVEVVPIVKRTYKEGYGDPTYAEYGGDRSNPFYSNMIYDEAKKTLDFEVDVTEYAHINESYSGENNYYDFTWEGNVYISCGDYGANDRTYAISIDPTPGIVLSQTSALMYPGSTFELSVNNNTGSDAPLSRTSSDPEVATIDEYGKITAIAPGQAIITVSNGTDSAVCVVAVRERATEVLDFDLSVDKIEGLKSDTQATVQVVNLYPADVELTDISWSVEEDEDYLDYAEGLLNVMKNSSDGLSGSVYMNVSSSEELLPAGHGVLTVTLNGVSRTADIYWDDIYQNSSQDGLLPTGNYQDQVVYVNQGESAELAAKYRNTSEHSVNDVITELTGLTMDGPDFFSLNGSYTTKLVNNEGYALPENIHVYTRYNYSDGSIYDYEMMRDNYYGYTYDSTTGEIVIRYTPTGATNQLRIVADGVESPGAPAGTLSGTTYERPEPLYGPFDWTLTEGSGTMESTTITEYYGSTYEGVSYTPSEPGVSRITATTKNGLHTLDFTVVCLPIKADTLTLDANKMELKVRTEGQAKVTLSPEPTLEEDKELIWKSFDESVATVDENGIVTGVSEGYAYILVSSKADTSVTNYLVVHVLPNPEGNKVTFVDEDGNVIGELLTDEEGSITPPEAPEKEGYTFVGWADADGNPIELDENGKMTGILDATTITAKYEINKYKVTFVADGKVVSEIEKEYNSFLTDEDYPAVPEKEGYTGRWENYPFAITGDITLEAKYESSSVTPTDPAKPTDPATPTNPGGTNGAGNHGGSQTNTGSQASTTSGNAKTGDTSHTALWAALIVLALGAVIALVIYRRKRS